MGPQIGGDDDDSEERNEESEVESETNLTCFYL